MELSQKEAFAYKQQAWFWLRQAYGMKYASDLLLRQMTERGDAVVMKITAGDSRMAMTSEMKLSDMILGPYMFMAGMALENLLKGVRVLTCPDLINLDTGVLNKKLKTHDLSGLIEDLVKNHKLDLCDLFCESDFEIDEFITKLSNYVKWAGKYPVALNHQEQEICEFDREMDPERFAFVFGQIARIVDDTMREHGGAHVVFPRVLR